MCVWCVCVCACDGALVRSVSESVVRVWRYVRGVCVCVCVVCVCCVRRVSE